MAGYLSKFRVRTGRNIDGDPVLFLEHFHDDGNCYVLSTIDEFTAQKIVELAGEHVKSCSK